MLSSLLSAEKIYFSDTLEPISLWATIGVVVAVALTLLFSFILEKESFNKTAKCALLAFVFYALAMGITLLVAEILKKFDTAYLEENWVSLDVVYYLLLPLLITLFLALVGGIIAFILGKKGSPKSKTFSRVYIIVLAVLVVITLVLIGMHYGKNIVGDGYYSKYLNSNALYISALLVVAFTLVATFIIGRKDKKPFDTHCISLAGACVALSFALSYVKLWDMPAGGSITLLSFLPIMLFAYIYGMKKGLLVGFLYGVLQAVQDPWLIHPAQFILDYPIAFSMVCFAGLFTDLNVFNKLPQLKFGISALIGGSLRFFCHVLSGVFAFGAYAADLGIDNFWAYSLAYNSYVFIDIALVIVFGAILLSSKGFNGQVEKLKLSK